jgi:hypothetical protein
MFKKQKTVAIIVKKKVKKVKDGWKKKEKD